MEGRGGLEAKQKMAVVLELAQGIAEEQEVDLASALEVVAACEVDLELVLAPMVVAAFVPDLALDRHHQYTFVVVAYRLR